VLGRAARVIVVGATGVGKSTLARRLAARLDSDFLELDALFWDAKWTPASPEVFRARVDTAIAGPAWVAAGNYGRVRDLLWPRATAIVWLDYALPLVVWGLTARTLRRAVTREVLWNGNRENLWQHGKLWSEDSLFYWLFKTYWRYRREFPAHFAEPAHAHIQVIHLRSRRETEAWLASVDRPRG
jgi:adenylate kinase family enzyme